MANLLARGLVGIVFGQEAYILVFPAFEHISWWNPLNAFEQVVCQPSEVVFEHMICECWLLRIWMLLSLRIWAYDLTKFKSDMYLCLTAHDKYNTLYMDMGTMPWLTSWILMYLYMRNTFFFILLRICLLVICIRVVIGSTQFAGVTDTIICFLYRSCYCSQGGQSVLDFISLCLF